MFAYIVDKVLYRTEIIKFIVGLFILVLSTLISKGVSNQYAPFQSNYLQLIIFLWQIAVLVSIVYTFLEFVRVWKAPAVNEWSGWVLRWLLVAVVILTGCIIGLEGITISFDTSLYNYLLVWSFLNEYIRETLSFLVCIAIFITFSLSEKRLKKEKNLVSTMTQFVWFILALVGGYFVFILQTVSHYEKLESWAQLGDSFGVLTSVLTALTLVAMIITLHYQRQELQAQRSEMKEARAVQEESKEAQVELTKLQANLLRAQTEQNNIQKEEHLISQLTKVVNNVQELISERTRPRGGIVSLVNEAPRLPLTIKEAELAFPTLVTEARKFCFLQKQLIQEVNKDMTVSMRIMLSKYISAYIRGYFQSDYMNYSSYHLGHIYTKSSLDAYKLDVLFLISFVLSEANQSEVEIHKVFDEIEDLPQEIGTVLKAFMKKLDEMRRMNSYDDNN